MRMRRKILLIIFAVIILVGSALLCAIRWNVWFGNVPETDYVVPQRPHNIVLSYGENAVAQRIVSWRSDTLLQPSIVRLVANSDTIIIPAKGELIQSRAGKAAFYSAALPPLPSGTYPYQCQSGIAYSDWRHFTLHADEGAEFLLFGDVQDKLGQSSPLLFKQAFDAHPSVHFAAFVGDIIERPTDTYWQLWFRSMQNHQEYIPLVAATGNHEYLKGIVKSLDNRWTHIFVNPDNGPQRFMGTSYFIDFPSYRLIVIDTDALQLFSDYTITQTWLDKVLTLSSQPWNIVVMHHPIYAAGKGRSNPTLWMALHHTLKKADVVFCGHDHNYMRRNAKPVYILTNFSDKFYQPKHSVKADKHAAFTRFYEYVRIAEDSLSVYTYQADTDSLFDTITLTRKKSRNAVL